MTDPELEGTALDEEFHAQTATGGHRKAGVVRADGRAAACRS